MQLISLKGYFAILISCLLIAAAAVAWNPDNMLYLIREDSVMENLTALLFLATAVVALRSSIALIPYRKFQLCIAVTGLLCFFDEISFGERLFDLQMPILGNTKIDAIHDLFTLVIENIWHHTNSHWAYLLFPAILIPSILLHKKRSWLTLQLTDPLQRQLFILFTLFALEVAAALIIDAHHRLAPFMVAAEEFLETAAAIALLFAAHILQIMATKAEMTEQKSAEPPDDSSH